MPPGARNDGVCNLKALEELTVQRSDRVIGRYWLSKYIELNGFLELVESLPTHEVSWSQFRGF